MLVNPVKARDILKKAGSTNFINYAEITIRMMPAAAMVVYAEYSRFPEVLKIVGWFMLVTSLILYFVPRRFHHNYALKSAEILNNNFIRFLSPISVIFGLAIIYSVI